MVGDGDPMGVAAQVAEHLFGATRLCFRVSAKRGPEIGRGQGISEKLVTNNFETKEMNRWPELRLSEREWIGKNC